MGKRRSFGAGSVTERKLKDGTSRFDVRIRGEDGRQKHVAACDTREEAEALLVLQQAAARRAEAAERVEAVQAQEPVTTGKRRGGGAGCITERRLKNGTPRFDVRVRGEDGRQKHIASCATREEADAFLALNAVRRAESGQVVPVDLGVMTMRNLGRLYLSRSSAELPVTAQSQWRARIETADFIDWPIVQITPQSIRRWIDVQARTPIATGKRAGQLPARNTLQNVLNLLRDIFKWAVIREHLDVNPAKGVTLSESTTQKLRSAPIGHGYPYLNEAEVKHLIAAKLPAKQRAAFLLLVFTGARPKDLYLLTWERVDIRARRVVFRTHKKQRDYAVSLLPQAHEAFRTWWIANGQPTSGLVFPSRWGTPHKKSYDFGWGAPRRGKIGYCEGIGMPRSVPLYSLRHTAASHLLLGTELFTGGRRWTPEEVASFLGHADLMTVRRYLVGLGSANIRAVEETRIALREARQKSDSR